MGSEHSKWVKNPKIYEINTWPWLNYLSEIYNDSITLQNVPEEIFNQKIKYFDAIWLMGVWERSPASKKIAFEHSELQEEYHKTLHDFKDNDVIGSPYSIYYYQVDNNIGSFDGLETFRKRLNERNIKLILDYVPNHVSIDSLWTFEPNLFIKGTLDELMAHPYEFFSIGENVFANGRDPNFPPWSDVIQINAFSEAARQKTINTLLNIAKICEGVRCDMAMLMTNKIFQRTWSDRAGSLPDKDFWEEIIPAVKEKYPNFLFIGEVYWDMEWELQQQGFDFCYDKKLYDKLVYDDVNSIINHLKAEWAYQSKLIRFIENHDELRAIEKFGEEKSKAAALITMSLPGGKLIHEGQMVGNRIKLPIQLGRSPPEKPNKKMLNFYRKLLTSIPGKEFGNGSWALCESKSVDPNDSSFSNIISYLWWINEKYRLIIVNYSSSFSKAHIKISPFHFDTYKWKFTDLLTQKSFRYKGDDLYKFGLYVELHPWKGHIFDIQKESY